MEQYFDNEIFPCRACEVNPDLALYLTFNKLPSFKGSRNTPILLLGHSPKVRTRSNISVTLDLSEDRRLKQYIVGEVLAPLGISLECCAATNVVKCLTTQMPEDIVIQGTPLVVKAFGFCKRHLVEEIRILKPRLIVSFSQTVATLLQKEFCPGQASRPMKDIFATLRALTISEMNIDWIPVVHIPKGKVRDCYFPEQTHRLMELRDKASRFLNK